MEGQKLNKLSVIEMAMVFVLSVVLAAYADDAPSEKAQVNKGNTKITVGAEVTFRGEYTHNRYDQLNDGTQYTSTTVITTNNTNGKSSKRDAEK
ncbi:MAG: hypothetical protein L7F77_15805 [Candidatus Magnetominusculus sp. LBB02]|nr:hypothetical protein [Candidatus Magnetominusculus sp. LBB02]